MPNYFLSSMLFSHELIQYMFCTYSCVLYRKYYHKQKSQVMRVGSSIVTMDSDSFQFVCYNYNMCVGECL